MLRQPGPRTLLGMLGDEADPAKEDSKRPPALVTIPRHTHTHCGQVSATSPSQKCKTISRTYSCEHTHASICKFKHTTYRITYIHRIHVHIASPHMPHKDPHSIDNNY